MLNFRTILLIFLSVFAYQIKSAQSSQNTLSPEACVYLQAKEVPKELKEKLDKIFLSETVIKGLEIIYGKGSASDIKKGLDILSEKGFHFLKRNVFCHKLFPEFVFKIGLIDRFRTEMRNAGRIRFAELLNGKANNKIRTPIKYAYMPYVYRFNCDYAHLPICIVVSQHIDSSKSSSVPNEHYWNSLLFKNNYHDIHRGNYYEFKDHIMVIDTEPHERALDYPKIKSKL